jgi:hypothetical protein
MHSTGAPSPRYRWLRLVIVETPALTGKSKAMAADTAKGRK